MFKPSAPPDIAGGEVAWSKAEAPAKPARPELERQRQSEGWRRAITADTPRTTLERSIGLLNGNDETGAPGLRSVRSPTS
jgi:hypothetical protein